MLTLRYDANLTASPYRPRIPVAFSELYSVPKARDKVTSSIYPCLEALLEAHAWNLSVAILRIVYKF